MLKNKNKKSSMNIQITFLLIAIQTYFPCTINILTQHNFLLLKSVILSDDYMLSSRYIESLGQGHITYVLIGCSSKARSMLEMKESHF